MLGAGRRGATEECTEEGGLCRGYSDNLHMCWSGRLSAVGGQQSAGDGETSHVTIPEGRDGDMVYCIPAGVRLVVEEAAGRDGSGLFSITCGWCEGQCCRVCVCERRSALYCIGSHTAG